MWLHFELNGRAVGVECEPEEPLLDVLRDRLGVTSPKNGCKPQGQCGACLALVDGAPKTTCAVPAAKVEGKRVTTVEGIDAADKDLLARAFVASAGSQCGFCIPGLLLRAWHLVARNPDPSRDEIARAIDVHLCRCTGYVKIVDAVARYAAAKRGEPLPEPDPTGRVGAPAARYEARDAILGERKYTADLRFPGMVHGALVLSPHARARVRRIDVARAAAMPGVVRVATAADVPGARSYGLLVADQTGLVAESETTCSVGDALAVVAAEDERAARAAAAAVEVDWEVLEPVTDPERALLPDAPQVNLRARRLDGEPANLLSRSVIRRGHVDAALALSPHIVSGTWRTQRIEHLFLETECAVALPLEGGRVKLYTQGQGIFDDRRQIASFLGLPEDAVEVELRPSGGAFGGKEDVSVQAHAALLARLTGRPAKVALSREESIRIHPKRHPLTLDYTVACDAEGYVTAVRARIIGDSGAYASVGGKVLERAAGHACGAYHVENVDVEALAVYTNNPPCGAMRGFGAPQTAFAIEGALDLLAAKAGLDPWEIRFRNALEVGDRTTTGQQLTGGVGLKKTLLAVKDAYLAARAEGLPAGVACGIKNCGIGNGVAEWGKARLVVEPDETVTIYNGYTEMGQGLLTVLIQCACEETGLPFARFRARVDSTYALDCGQTTGSRATFFGGKAVAAAARRLRADLDAGKTLAELAGAVYPGDLVDRSTTPLGAPGAIKTHPSYGYATQVVILDREGRLERVIAAHDVGRAINPRLCEGQIEGAVHMGLGYALSEELPCKSGMPTSFGMREIGVLRARDMPAVEVILIEEADPDGPFGAKGLGEIGLVPTAAAVAGALAAHDGVRRTSLPMRDSAAARALSVGRRASHGGGGAHGG